MEYQRAMKSAQKEQSKTPSSPPRQTALNHVAVHPLLRLQQTIGNQAVQNMLRCGEMQIDPMIQASIEPRFGYDFSQIPIHSPMMGGIQTKLAINKQGDEYEQEADHIAEQVMRISEPQIQSVCACGGACSKCQTQQSGREHENLQTKRVRSSDLEQTVVPPIVHEVLAAPGQPLDSAARDFMEPRFDHDLNGIRVHTDAKAADSAESVNALAYTVGQHIVFGEGRYAPASIAGQRLLAHEIVHVLQPTADTRIARETDEEKEDRAKNAPEDAPPKAEATPPGGGTPQADTGTETNTIPVPPPAVAPPVAAKPITTPGGHTPAPPGMAACPDAPQRPIVIVGCTTMPASSPPDTEKAVLPTLDPGPFGGDADRAKFAKELAQCRAEREVKGEIEKRFRSDVAAAKKSATEEAKIDTKAAIEAATKGLDPKDRKVINSATVQAAAEAKKAAAKKISDAQTAVKRQDVATVTAELATKYEDNLAADYDATITGALHRYNTLQKMQAKLNSERKRITKEKSAKPRVPKGTTPPPPKSADQIAAEVETEMVEVRCYQQQWARNELEGYSRAWAVSRREEVDYITIEKAPYLKDFKPTYQVSDTDLDQIPANLQGDKNMPGVAPELADFLTQLNADLNAPPFKATNYKGHGLGAWKGKGFSTDLYLTGPQDARGFWRHSDAVRFLLALDATAKKLGARWRVLYNDFGVIHEVNQKTGSRNVGFVGAPLEGDINWHGPAPLILHFHLDLEIPQKKPAEGSQP